MAVCLGKVCNGDRDEGDSALLALIGHDLAKATREVWLCQIFTTLRPRCPPAFTVARTAQ